MKRTARSAVFILSFSLFTLVRAEVGHPPGMLGVAVDEVLTSHVSELALPGEYGARVTDVAPGSPAKEAGLQPADVIVSYNGVRVESARAFQRMILETPAGRQVELRIIRNGSAILTQPTLGEGKRPATASAPADQAPKNLGVWIESVAPAVGQYLGLESGTGVIVRKVQDHSAADQAGIQTKDVLVKLGDESITSPEMVAEALNRLQIPMTTFTLIRGTETMDISVRF